MTQVGMAKTGIRLQAAGLGRGYLLEEVQYFVKGRALTTVEDYLALPRTARGTPLRADQRRDLWGVATLYRAACEQHRVRDFDDLVVDACKELEMRPLDQPAPRGCAQGHVGAPVR